MVNRDFWPKRSAMMVTLLIIVMGPYQFGTGGQTGPDLYRFILKFFFNSKISGPETKVFGVLFQFNSFPQKCSCWKVSNFLVPCLYPSYSFPFSSFLSFLFPPFNSSPFLLFLYSLLFFLLRKSGAAIPHPTRYGRTTPRDVSAPEFQNENLLRYIQSVRAIIIILVLNARIFFKINCPSHWMYLFRRLQLLQPKSIMNAHYKFQTARGKSIHWKLIGTCTLYM